MSSQFNPIFLFQLFRSFNLYPKNLTLLIWIPILGLSKSLIEKFIIGNAGRVFFGEANRLFIVVLLSNYIKKCLISVLSIYTVANLAEEKQNEKTLNISYIERVLFGNMKWTWVFSYWIHTFDRFFFSCNKIKKFSLVNLWWRFEIMA